MNSIEWMSAGENRLEATHNGFDLSIHKWVTDSNGEVEVSYYWEVTDTQRRSKYGFYCNTGLETSIHDAMQCVEEGMADLLH